MLGEKKRALSHAKISSINESEIKMLTDKGKLKEFIASKPRLKDFPKEVHQRKGNDRRGTQMVKNKRITTECK